MRIRRADLPEQNSQAVYQRMQTERQREAAEFRAQGAQRAPGDPLARRPRGDRAGRRCDHRSPSRSRGEGDATRNQIFADAFNKDPDFFAFYRSMQAYETGLKPNDTRFLLKPDSNFFRYFNHPSGKVRRLPRRQRLRPPRRAATSGRRFAARRVDQSAQDARFPGRARAGLRDRGTGRSPLSGRGQAGDGRVMENADADVAADRPRFGGRRPDLVWLVRS